MVILAGAAGWAGAVDDGLAAGVDGPLADGVFDTMADGVFDSDGVELGELVVDEAAADGVDALCPAPTG